MVRMLLISLALCISNIGISQVQYRIRLENYNLTFIPDRCADTLVREIENGVIKIFLKTCSGQLDFELYSRDSILKEKGSYCQSLKLYKKSIRAVGASGSSGKRKIYYYLPLKNGEWKYFENGVMKYVEKYNCGVLLTN